MEGNVANPAFSITYKIFNQEIQDKYVDEYADTDSCASEDEKASVEDHDDNPSKVVKHKKHVSWAESAQSPISSDKSQPEVTRSQLDKLEDPINSTLDAILQSHQNNPVSHSYHSPQSAIEARAANSKKQWENARIKANIDPNTPINSWSTARPMMHALGLGKAAAKLPKSTNSDLDTLSSTRLQTMIQDHKAIMKSTPLSSLPDQGKKFTDRLSLLEEKLKVAIARESRELDLLTESLDAMSIEPSVANSSNSSDASRPPLTKDKALSQPRRQTTGRISTSESMTIIQAREKLWAHTAFASNTL